MAALYAHTDAEGTLEHGQLLLDHLRAVAERACTFAEPVGAGVWAYWVGMLHDAGKASEDFQRRLRGDARPVDHATGGARLATQRYGGIGRLLAFPIVGHHGGMPNWRLLCEGGRTPLKMRLDETKDIPLFEAPYEQLVQLPSLEELAGAVPRCLVDPAICCQAERAFGLYMTEQMIFSSLVDADFLDTESVMSPDRAHARTSHPLSLAQLAALLDAYMDALSRSAGMNSSPVNKVRAEVLRQCKLAALAPSGLFSLEVPTGGGKTLAALSFALHHALHAGQKRVIIAIPFTSIVEQTASTLKRIFGPENVLEHHSTYDYERASHPNGSGDAIDDERALRERLLVQNWDAPVIVTTNVQLFESLFSNKPSRCRKNHNIADSVIILDEVQTLPDHLLKPTLAMLQTLCDCARATALLCTATQPNFDECWPFPSRPRAIVHDKEGDLFAPLMGRVAYETDRTECNPLSLGELVDMLVDEDRALCIVSSRGAARQVYEAMRERLGSERGLFHLSGLMIPEHRRQVIGDIRARLAEGLPCRVVSTQLIEAGVDVDFPVVFRETAGIDSIIQAAGRCNREGSLEGKGRVVVFACPEFGKRFVSKECDGIDGNTNKKGRADRTWLGQMRQLGLEVIDQARDGGFDAFGKEGVRRFFSRRYGVAGGFGKDGLDAPAIYRSIVGKRDGSDSAANEGTFSFEKYAADYRFITDEGRPIFVPWGEEGQVLLGRIESGEISADLQRALQCYTVAVPLWTFKDAYADHVRPIGPFNVLEDRSGAEHLYSEKLGLLASGDGEYDLLVI